VDVEAHVAAGVHVHSQGAGGGQGAGVGRRLDGHLVPARVNGEQGGGGGRVEVVVGVGRPDDPAGGLGGGWGGQGGVGDGDPWWGVPVGSSRLWRRFWPLAVVNAKFDTGIPPTADQYEIVLVKA
jgi:hypothetical protein